MQFIRDRAQQHRIPWPKPNHPRPDQRRRTVLLVVYKKILHHFPFPVPNAGRSCAHERWIETQTMIKKKAIKKKKNDTQGDENKTAKQWWEPKYIQREPSAKFPNSNPNEAEANCKGRWKAIYVNQGFPNTVVSGSICKNISSKRRQLPEVLKKSSRTLLPVTL